MIVAIAAAEVAFWILLGGGLALRYLARARRISTVVLLAVPLVDLALVGLVAVDVLRGAAPRADHGLAVMYLGVTVAFGHPIVRWADSWFAYRFAGGPRPRKPAKGSAAYVRATWQEWLRVLAAAAIAAACLLLMIAFAGWRVPTSIDDAATHPYWSTVLLVGLVTIVWFIAGPVSTTIAHLAGGSTRGRE